MNNQTKAYCLAMLNGGAMYVFGALVNGLIIVPAIIPAIIVVYTMVYIIEAIEMRLDLSEAIKES